MLNVILTLTLFTASVRAGVEPPAPDRDRAFAGLVDPGALDVGPSASREAAAQKFLAARGESVLPNLAWDLMDPEVQRAIAFDEEVERLVDAEIAATQFTLKSPHHQLSAPQTRAIERVIDLFGPDLSAGNRAALRSILAQLAVTTAGLPTTDRAQVNALDLKAEAVGRLIRRARRAHDPRAVEVAVITAMRLVMKAHLIAAATAGRPEDLRKARDGVGFLVGFLAPFAGVAAAGAMHDVTGIILFFGSLPFSVASAKWGGPALGMVWPNLFKSRVHRQRAERLIENFWRRVEPYLPPRTTSADLGPARSFVDEMLAHWPGNLESLCTRVLTEVTRPRR